MDKRLAHQYDGFVDNFLKDHHKYNEDSRRYFYSRLEDSIKPGNKLLDVACGDGKDLAYYSEKGAICFGIDSSKELIKKARINCPSADIAEGYMERLPYKDNSFDIVLSKWAMQSSNDIPKVIQEMHRVLKPEGIIAYLTVHPIRQFIEKKKHPQGLFQARDSTFYILPRQRNC